MPHPSPQIIYGEDGILRVSEPSLTDNTGRVLEALEALPAVTVAHGDMVYVEVEVGKLLDSATKDEFNLETVLNSVGLILPVHPRDGLDRVMGLEWLSGRGANGAVYPRFQRWLNNSPIPEDIAREALFAMAVPFGASKIRQAKNDFNYRAGVATDGLLTIGARMVTFDHRLNGTSESVQWRALNLATLGLCACWGVDEWQIRKALLPKLYEMRPHNIDTAKQALSLVLGMGVLARYAAEHEGLADIFADT